MTLLLVVSALAAVPAATMAQEATQTEQAAANETAPGAQLAGVVGVQEAELDGEVDSRAYGIRVAQANTEDAKADVVADQLGDVEQRLNELETQRETLEAARDNGSMSEGEYRAKAAKLHAESKTAQRLANQTNETASELPAEKLEARGINATAIQTLSARAENLTGQEVAQIARGIAGENVGQQARPDVAGDRDADRPDNETERDGEQTESQPVDTETETVTENETVTEQNTTTSTDRNTPSDAQSGGY